MSYLLFATLIVKLINENEKSASQIKEWRNRYITLESDLEKANQSSQILAKSRDDLKLELDSIKEQFSGSLSEKTTRIEQYEETINQLQLELTKSNSKLDEAYYQLSEAKKTCSNQLKQVSTFDFLIKSYFPIMKLLQGCKTKRCTARRVKVTK